MSDAKPESRTVHVHTKEPAKFACAIDVGPLTLLADEPAENDGTDTGPMPHEFLLAALGACTAMTLKLYAARKGIALTHVDVSLDGVHEARDGGAPGERTFKITRKVTLTGTLTDAERARLLEIASKCPVHKTLTSPITIENALD